MKLIDADELIEVAHRVRLDSRERIERMIESAPTVDTERHGYWIKMSDADGVYYECSECGDELPRVINSFNPQFDLFPKLKCIDKTTYCPNCGAKMDESKGETKEKEEDDGNIISNIKCLECLNAQNITGLQISCSDCGAKMDEVKDDD